jgi:hypothetical protein
MEYLLPRFARDESSAAVPFDCVSFQTFGSSAPLSKSSHSANMEPAHPTLDDASTLASLLAAASTSAAAASRATGPGAASMGDASGTLEAAPPLAASIPASRLEAFPIPAAPLV